MTRRGLAAATSACVAMAAASGPGGPAVAPLAPAFEAGMLTWENADHYGVTVEDGVVTAAAPDTNEGSNTRVALWLAAEEASLDHETCSTWVDARSDLQQQGATLRVRSVGGRTTAVTVTNNVYFHARWVFNVHVMDSADEEEPFRRIASFDLSEVFRPGGPDSYEVPPYPWRMCARVVGDTVSFVVWPLWHVTPSWDDPLYGGSVTLPTGWDRAGNPGWYVGHLEPGGSVGFADLSTAVITPRPWLAAQRPDVTAPEPTTPPRRPTWVPVVP